MKAPEYLWKQVAGELMKRIQDKNLENGDPFPSLREVCRKYGVSLITAKRIFMELERAGYIWTMPGKGTFIASPRESLAINLIIPERISFERHDINISFLLTLIRGITESAAKAGVRLHTYTSLDFVRDIKNQGLILLNYSWLEREKLDQAAKNNYVVLYLHSPDKMYGTICLDAQKGMYMVTKHLLSLGHRRIGFISGLITNPWQTPRFEGYLKALRSAGIKNDWRLIKELPSPDQDGINSAMRELLAVPEPPTAVAASNDTRALLVLEYCRNHGLKVPRDFAVAGFDNIPEAELSNPSLTTADAHYYRVGQCAVEQVINLARNKKSAKKDIIVKPALIKRDSTG